MVKMNRNEGTYFELIQPMMKTSVNMPAVEDILSSVSGRTEKDKSAQIASLLKAVTCLDLTTLSSDDTECNALCLSHRAKTPIDENLLEKLGLSSEKFQVGAICVYPARIKDCVETLKYMKAEIPVAAVAAGFPSAQYPLKSKLEEIKCCIEDGAKEIDIVISRQLVLHGKWEDLYNEVKAMKEVCGSGVLLKTILAAGELGSLDSIYNASLVCMAAGSDFIKTSTGKESVNATLPIGVIMARAIKAYQELTGYEVGFKPAGGLRAVKDVLLWQNLMKKELGEKWLHPNLFRIGASGLLNDIENKVFVYVNSCNPSKHVFIYQ